MKRPVCIIDDDEDLRAAMCFALEFEGIPVVSLENGQRALEYLSTLTENEYPCLIILDYMMPEMDGLELIKLIKEKYPETLGSIPLALSTARDSLDSELKKMIPEIKTLAKPLDLKEFLSLAKSHCQEVPNRYFAS